MTTDDLVHALALPAEARVHLRVAKKVLTEQVPTAADRRLISDAVAACAWVGSLKPTTCGLAARRDGSVDYGEIAVLVLTLRPGNPGSARHQPGSIPRKSPRPLTRLHQLLHRAIPYPLVLITADEASAVPPTIALCHQRPSQATANAVVLDGDLISTDGLDLTPEFLASLSLASLQVSDLWACYDGWIARIEALRASAITGAWAVPRTASQTQRRRAALAAHGALERELADLHRHAVTTTQLNRRADCNLAIQALRQRLTALHADLNLEPIP